MYTCFVGGQNYWGFLSLTDFCLGYDGWPQEGMAGVFQLFIQIGWKSHGS